MSSDTELASSRLADRNWRWRHSAWMLAVCLGVGLLSFIGFVYCAFRVRSRKWWVIATVASLASAVTWIVSSFEDSAGEMTDWAAGVVFVIWVAMIIAGFQLNRDYLRWRASRTPAHAWYNHSGGQSAQGTPVAAPWQETQAVSPSETASPLQSMGLQRGDYYAPDAPPHAASAPASPPPTHAQIDVNRATAGELVTALQVDEALAVRVVEARQEQGGFRNIDELTATASLQPHQMMRFKNRVVFGSFQAEPHDGPNTGRGSGRILDF